MVEWRGREIIQLIFSSILNNTILKVDINSYKVSDQ